MLLPSVFCNPLVQLPVHQAGPLLSIVHVSAWKHSNRYCYRLVPRLSPLAWEHSKSYVKASTLANLVLDSEATFHKEKSLVTIECFFFFFFR